jgi:RNA polymerase sigma factor (sigma-70 family)
VRIHRLAVPDVTRIFEGETILGLSEYQLLERYRERHDQLAFEALVARYGPMVLGVCGRMLAEAADVEDAFQATFLVLVRRAGQLGPRDALGPWLYGVAARVCLRARSEAARRRSRHEPITAGSRALAEPRQAAGDQRELIEVLDQELNRLPTKYRCPLVLCYLEGQTHEEAARQLNWPLGTVKGRLARARDLLRMRLTRRGVALTAGGLAVVLADQSQAALETALLARTVKSSLKLALGETTVSVASTSVASLVEGVLFAMFLTKLRWFAAPLLVSAVALTGAGVMARQPGKAQVDRPAAQPAGAVASSAPLSVRSPMETSARPSGSAGRPDLSQATVPLETTASADASDINQQRIRSARSAFQAAYKGFSEGDVPLPLEQVYQSSRRLMEAHAAVAASREELTSAAKLHLERMKRVVQTQRVQRPDDSGGKIERAQAEALVTEAVALLAQAAEPRAEQADDKETSGEKPGKDHRSRLILSLMAEPLPMKYPTDTPLDDILEFIKKSTKSSRFPSGIPIYVDPIGLQEAEKTEQSTVKIDLEGVPLRRTLQLLLRQLGLAYLVEDGMIYITSEDSAKAHLDPPSPEESPILEEAKKAVRGELGVQEMQALIEAFKLREQIRRLLQQAESPQLVGGGLQSVPLSVRTKP